METCVVNFVYLYKNYNGKDEKLSFPIDIPYKEDYNELIHRIVALEMDPIMKYLDADKELKIQLEQFITRENQDFYDRRDEGLLNKARNGQDIDSLIKDLERLYKEEVLEYAERVGPTDSEIFAQSYHRLVHSSSLVDVLNKEQSYAEIITDVTNRMDSELESLINNQQTEMESKLKQLENLTSQEDTNDLTKNINSLITIHCSKTEMMRKKWESELDAKRGHQKNDYRNWITSNVGDSFLNSPLATPIGHKSSIFLNQTPAMEESFTIHLGSQLKHMHNIRILSSSVTDLCSPLHCEENLGGFNIALGLYSSSLSGVVVLTKSCSVIQADPIILKNANMSTEFHFQQIDNQIEEIEFNLEKPNKMSQETPEKKIGKLKPGDFFITKHSNLSQSHIVFHLISDEPFQSPSEINSRHPVILGLRNILKTASKHDVTTLTIPALLRHEMSEEMTVSWCMRRAELVFKCAKGFMIESSSWGGTELSTLQLLLPHDISEELFSTLTGMVPHVFRVANAKIL